jgi:hypothetical protein
VHPNRLTRFTSRYAAGSLIDCLAFGDPVNHHEERNRRTVYHFRPGQIFGVVWWRKYSEDRQHRALAVIEALPAGQTGYVLPGIQPGVTVHAIVDQHGPGGQDGAVDQLLDVIHDLKHRRQNPASISPNFWVETAHQILLCQSPFDSYADEGVACPV